MNVCFLIQAVRLAGYRANFSQQSMASSLFTKELLAFSFLQLELREPGTFSKHVYISTFLVLILLLMKFYASWVGHMCFFKAFCPIYSNLVDKSVRILVIKINYFKAKLCQKCYRFLIHTPQSLNEAFGANCAHRLNISSQILSWKLFYHWEAVL